MRKVALRKGRTGIWHSTGQGSGKTQNSGARTIPDGSGDTFDEADEDDNDTDDGLSADDERKKLKNEAKRRRLQAREWRRRAEAAEAKLGDDGQSSGPDRSDLVLSLVEAGMSKDRIRAAMKLVDWSKVTDVDDAIEDLREEHEFLFTSVDDKDDAKDLPAQGRKGIGTRTRAALLAITTCNESIRLYDGNCSASAVTK